MKPFRSHPLDLPAERGDVVRADLVLYGVDHSGPTYEARVFLDNDEATKDTPLDPEQGYAGAYTIFGHGGCFGGEGHCAARDRYVDEFDRRPPHPLTPQTVTVTVTEALARIKKRKVGVTVVPVAIEGGGREWRGDDIPPCERVRLVTYA